MIPIIKIDNSPICPRFVQIGCFKGEMHYPKDWHKGRTLQIVIPEYDPMPSVIAAPNISEKTTLKTFDFYFSRLYRAPDYLKQPVRHSEDFFWRWAIVPVSKIYWDHEWFLKLGEPGCENIQ